MFLPDRSAARRRGLSAACLAILAVTVFGTVQPVTAGNPGFGPDTEEGEHAAELLIAQKCVMCHDLVIVTSRQATVDEWKEITARMVSYGAQVSDAEIEAIIDYLSASDDQE